MKLDLQSKREKNRGAKTIDKIDKLSGKPIEEITETVTADQNKPRKSYSYNAKKQL